MAGTRRAYYWRPQVVPTFPVEVDWSHPLARSIGDCCVFVPKMCNYSAPSWNPYVTGSVLVGGTARGPGLIAPISSTDYINAVGNRVNYAAGDFTVSVLFRAATPTANYSNLFVKGTAAGNRELGVWLNTANNINYIAIGSSFNPGGVLFTTGMIAGNIYEFTITRQGTLVTCYINGSPVGTDSTNTSGTTSYGTSYTLGFDPYNGGLVNPPYPATYLAFRGWPVALPQSLIKELAAEPFAMLRPRIRRQYYVSSGIPSGSAEFIGSGQLSATVSATLIATASFNGSGLLTADAIVQAQAQQASASLLGQGALTAQAYLRLAAASAFQGNGQLTAYGSLNVSALSFFNGAGSFSADATVQTSGIYGTASLSGSGAIAAKAYLIAISSSALDGQGSFEAQATHAPQAQASFIGRGSLYAQVTHTPSAEALMLGAGRFLSSANPIILALSDFPGSGLLSASTIAFLSARASWNGSGMMVAAANQISISDASMKGAGMLTANATVLISNPVYRRPAVGGSRATPAGRRRATPSGSQTF